MTEEKLDDLKTEGKMRPRHLTTKRICLSLTSPTILRNTDGLM